MVRSRGHRQRRLVAIAAAVVLLVALYPGGDAETGEADAGREHGGAGRGTDGARAAGWRHVGPAEGDGVAPGAPAAGRGGVGAMGWEGGRGPPFPRGLRLLFESPLKMGVNFDVLLE